MTGYSGTSLSAKLGIKPHALVYVGDAPGDYLDWLGPLPAGARVSRRFSGSADLVHLFATRRAALEKKLERCRRHLRSEVPVWASWPKKASKVATDITEDVVRELALPLGFVDVKVCAVTAIWSGLKLVVRKELR